MDKKKLICWEKWNLKVFEFYIYINEWLDVIFYVNILFVYM